VLLVFPSGMLQAQKIYIEENIAYWNNINSELQLNHNVYFDNGLAQIFLEISLNRDQALEQYHFIYELHESYHTLDIRESDTLDIRAHIIAEKGNTFYCKFELPNEEKTDLAIFRIINKRTGIDYVYDIPFIEDYNFSTDGLVLYEEDGNTPYLKSFINKGTPLQVKSINPFNGQIYVYYYGQYFDEAVPPHFIEDNRAAKGLTIDSTFMLQTGDKFTPQQEGLYFFQKDSSSADGISIRVQDRYFPLVKSIDEVLEPLIYISTRGETDGIRNAANKRAAFEKYWINLVKVPNVATATVSKFYDRVEAANFLFTNFEEGWKSDMGMIYIVYGPPNDVYKSEEIIDWVYSRDLTMPVIRFSFYKVKNVFTPDHYTLLRKKNYENNWFKSVELWRTGKK
jgi:GWxTD domain-containing protein